MKENGESVAWKEFQGEKKRRTFQLFVGVTQKAIPNIQVNIKLAKCGRNMFREKEHNHNGSAIFWLKVAKESKQNEYTKSTTVNGCFIYNFFSPRLSLLQNQRDAYLLSVYRLLARAFTIVILSKCVQFITLKQWMS